MKPNFIRRSLAVILCYAFMLTNTSYGEAASPLQKSQLTTLVANASQSWPKNGAYTLYTNSEVRPYEVYYYADQIMTIAQVPGIQKSLDSRVVAFDPQYFYIKFPNDTVSGKKLLISNNVKSLDWARFNEGYNMPADKLSYDPNRVRNLLTFPTILTRSALLGAEIVSYDAKSKVYSITGKCDGKKCLTTISFKANGSYDKINCQLADGTGWAIFVNLKAPEKPIIDRTRVLDYNTSKIAKY